jgi:hypothetical protein
MRGSEHPVLASARVTRSPHWMVEITPPSRAADLADSGDDLTTLGWVSRLNHDTRPTEITMPTKGTDRASYRLSEDIRQKLRLIGESRGGLNETDAIRLLANEEWERMAKRILRKAGVVS